MPPIFKALTSISVWILFLTGCLSILTSLPIPFVSEGDWQLLTVGVVSIILSLVAVRIRKTLG
ncbi:MAG: hypothetical protein PHU23_16815 [Dehalococcoidales bacterium]|nr:hypothetical protein [Dehalococcoidales bacterium]